VRRLWRRRRRPLTAAIDGTGVGRCTFHR
jgi:hypothetical protein